MYSLPSASVTRAPRPLVMNTGSTPTERHARTGEFTPPGMIARARSKMDWLRWVDIAREPDLKPPPLPRAPGPGLTRCKLVGSARAPPLSRFAASIRVR
jgi:hypothetical protein